MSTTIMDLRLLPSVEITETFLGARAKCLDCGDVEELRDVAEAKAWRADHEGCQAVVDEAHAEALIEEARRLELHLISRSGTIHVEDLHRTGHYLCSTAALTRLPSTAGRTSARPDCAACARKVDQAQERAYTLRHTAMLGYSESAPAAARHWQRLTAAEQARWLDWACWSGPAPARDVAADVAELDAVARWAADGIDIEQRVARLLDPSSGADPAPTVQVPPVPNEVRAAGWKAMVEAAETTVDLAQIYARTLEAVLLPLYAAWVGDKHVMELPEPDEADQVGASWGTAVHATIIGSSPVVQVVGKVWMSDDAFLRAAEIVAAARWGCERMDEIGAAQELAEAEQSGGAL